MNVCMNDQWQQHNVGMNIINVLYNKEAAFLPEDCHLVTPTQLLHHSQMVVDQTLAS